MRVDQQDSNADWLRGLAFFRQFNGPGELREFIEQSGSTIEEVKSWPAYQRAVREGRPKWVMYL